MNNKDRRKLPSVYPTPRLAAAFALGALWFIAVLAGGDIFLWLGIAYNLLLVAVTTADYFLLGDSHACTAERHCQTTLSLGEHNLIKIWVTYYGRRPIQVQVRDEPPIEFEVERRHLSFRMDPNETDAQGYRVLPKERGDYHFGDLNVRLTTRLGFLMRQERIPAAIRVKVYPDIFQTKKHHLLAKENRVIQMGLRHSRLRGQGREFQRLRDYVPDDDPRAIDWKATARRRSLIVREYDFEQSQNIMLLLDLGRTMASRTAEPDGTLGMTKADYAINACVLLSHVAADSDDRVGLFCFGEKPVCYVPPGKGRPQSARLMEALYPVQPRLEETNYYNNFRFFTEKQRRRSLVFLFTDLIDPDSSRRLISSMGLLVRKHLVVCVALADYELPAMIDAEPDSVSDLYRQAVALGIIKDRRRALAQLSAQGVIGLDTTFSALAIDAVNKYLQLKREARL